MKINAVMNDREGRPIEIGDFVELFDWGNRQESLGVVQVVWDDDEGKVSCFPCLVEDDYDFWTKALPHSKKVAKKGAGALL